MISRTRIARTMLFALGALLLLAGLFVAALFSSQAGGSRAQTIALVGETNGLLGPLVPIFVRLSTNDAIFVKRWLATGTNAAVFKLTNSQSCPVWLSPFAYLEKEGKGGGSYVQSLVLGAPTFSGIYLLPGKAATIEVALPREQERRRIMFQYTRDSCNDSLVNSLKMLPRVWRARANGTPVQIDSFSFFSDWISP
jgi:hypothetical protein